MNIPVNQFFDKIFIVNYILSDNDRYNNSINISNELGAQIIYGLDFSCLDSSFNDILYKHFPNNQRDKYLRNTLSCTISHYNCLLYAKKHNYDKILILEDDIEFHKDVWDSDDFIIPDDFDLIKFCFPIWEKENGNVYINKHFIKNDIYFAPNSGAYALNKRTIDLLIEYYKKITPPADYVFYSKNYDENNPFFIDKNLNFYWCDANCFNINWQIGNNSTI